MKNNKQTTISLEMLLLNDLLTSQVIDKDLYDRAAQKILSIVQVNQAGVAVATA